MRFQKGNKLRKGCFPWNKGLTKDNEIIRKGTKKMIKTKSSLEWKQKHKAWNKGLTKETDERIKKCAEKRKGIPKSEETKRKIRLTRKNLFDEGKLIGYWKNKKNPYLTKRNLENNPIDDLNSREKARLKKIGKHYSPATEFKKGQIPHNKGKTKDNYEPLRVVSKKYLEIRKSIIVPTKDTKIEVKIQNFLKDLGITFFTHQYIKEIEHGYQCDIFIPVQEGINQKTIIECFGTYWHKYPIGRDIDTLRCQELRDKGFRVFVFWENEINCMDLNDLKFIMEGLIK